MDYYKRLRGYRGKSIFLTPTELAEAAADYFQWSEDNPLGEAKLHFDKDGAASYADLDKVRAFSIRGFCSYCKIPYSRINEFRKRGKEWAEVVELIEGIIHTQTFENAAAGLLNANLVSRTLGLADKQEVTVEDTTPVERKVASTADQEQHLAVHVHPDDPDPLNTPRPLFSRAQLEAGVPFHGPAHAEYLPSSVG